MSLPVYVVNFDELAERIVIGDVTVTVDTSGAERILERYFPELIELLETRNKATELVGTQMIKGFATSGEAVTFVPETDIALTSVTFSQSVFGDGDKWSLSVGSGSAEISLLDGVYAKDALQHKHFERFYPVPSGYQIIMTPGGGDGKTYWFDLEYLEL